VGSGKKTKTKKKQLNNQKAFARSLWLLEFEEAGGSSWKSFWVTTQLTWNYVQPYR